MKPMASKPAPTAPSHALSTRRTILLACLVLSIGAGIGCGGEDDGGATAAGGGKAEFISKANAACAKESSSLMGRARTFEKRRAEADVPPEPYVDAVHFVFLPIVEEQINRIEELKLPAGEARRIDDMLDTNRSAIDIVATMPKVPSIAAARRHFADAEKLFLAFGLSACANGPGRESS
jgi:hypothetical protein